MSVLFFSYYAYKDPVFQSAVLAYVKRLAPQFNKHCYLVTFEHDDFPLDPKEIVEIEKDLLVNNISWRRLKWRSGGFKVVKKIWNLLEVLVFCSWLVVRKRCSLIYSEGFPGAILSYIVAQITGKQHAVHTFEPHADYMRESGVWTDKSWEYRLLKNVEKRIARGSDLIVTATKAYKDVIKSWGIKGEVLVIPSCIDLDKFKFNPASRDVIRKQFRYTDDDIVLVYLGKIGGMYMDQELFDFFKMCSLETSRNYKFLLLTGMEKEEINSRIDSRNLKREDFEILHTEPREVPEYLSAADVGLVAIRPIPSRRYSSPIKTGEYWACGLPVIIPAGMSDDFEIVEKEKIGIVLNDWKCEVNWAELIQVPRDKSRITASNYRSIDKAVEQIMRSINSI